MTDDELKALVASLAIDQKELTKKMAQTDEQMNRTDEQMRRNAEQMNRTDEQIRRTDEQMRRNNAEQMNRTDEQIRRTDEQMRRNAEQMNRTDEQIRRTDEQMRRNDEKLTRIAEMVGNVTQNQGDVAEEFFLHSLIKDNHLGPIYFDDVTKSLSKHRGKIQEEYDLLLTNGDAIAIIEVKYKVHENDLAKLDRKMHNFKKLFPIYQSFKQYGAIASFHINNKAKAEALQRGYFVLQRSGDLIHTESSGQLMVL